MNLSSAQIMRSFFRIDQPPETFPAPRSGHFLFALAAR